MPVPMVKCVVCKQEVSKRSTISLEHLGLFSGRACRTHTAVVQVVEEFEKRKAEAKAKADQERVMRDFQDCMKVMQGVALVRIGCSFWERSPELMFAVLPGYGLSPANIQKVREEVARIGARMSDAEMLESIIAAGELQKRLHKLRYSSDEETSVG